MVTQKLALTAILLATTLSLGACAGSPPPEETVAAPVTTISDTANRNDRNVQYAAGRENADTLERLYKRNPNDELVAGRYAKTLREEGELKLAEQVLQPFVKGNAPSTLTFTEMAALELETGDLKASESYARRAIKVDDNNYRAWHILGISLDAQLKHPEAETAFRKALALWQGDDVPVMNNLALNLAAQGYTDKALDMLYKAKEKGGDRVEIERNIRIIRTLNEPSEYDLSLPGMKGVKPVASKPKA